MRLTKTALLLLLIVPGVVFGWWNEEWSGRKGLVLDTTPAGADFRSAMTEVPVLVRLHSGNFTGFFELAEEGRDIRFVAGDDTTPLKYHVESIDPINELAFIWVKVPQIDAAVDSGKIWMYYGNGTVPSGADSGATYDANQALVLHFADAAKPLQDSSANANHPLSSSVRPVEGSLIGAGVSMDGGNGIRIPATPSLQIMPQQGWTFSAWIKPKPTEGKALLLRKGDGDGAIEIWMETGQAWVRYTDSTGMQTDTPPVAVTMDKWQQLMLTVGADSLTLYLDGVQRQALPVAVPAIGGELLLGTADEMQAGYVGELDEVQVSRTLRSADWIGASYRIQGSDKLVRPTEDQNVDSETGGTGGTSYMGTILNNVSLDGWLVMGLLGIMAVASWIIMALKTLMLNRMQLDNQEFIQAFRDLDPARPGALDVAPEQEDHEFDGAPVLNTLFGKHEHYERSNIFRVYHTGVQEVEHRLGRSVGATACLSPAALRVIRAALDATMVRESQKLNNLMVMLTIAISGGPFLGLLGTVLGVMITFAAIAISGDVNIDAIAPGVSAALMTTVAGLVVAIPALFGYNYLATRIRDMTADMHVFADEFEAKIAECHS
jgi:biopolymer transport protein ExbB